MLREMSSIPWKCLNAFIVLPQAALQRELEQQRRMTTTTTTNAPQMVQGGFSPVTLKLPVFQSGVKRTCVWR